MNVHVWILGVLGVLGCDAGKGSSSEGKIDTGVASQPVDTGAVVGDSAAPDTGEPTTDPPVSGMPAGQWSDCRGTLRLDAAGGWAWRDAEGSCVVEGTATLDGEILNLQVDAELECLDGLPWWMTGEGGLAGRHTFSVTDVRLSLVPEVLVDSTGSGTQNEKHFYGQLFRERWLVTNDEGLQSNFDTCFSPSGVFFEGGYQAVDGACDFISCGGAITGWRASEDGQLDVWTQCAGGCPCVGVLQTTTISETEMAGDYNFANCSRTGGGTFVGVQVPFPTGDMR